MYKTDEVINIEEAIQEYIGDYRVEPVAHIFTLFKNAGYELYIVGGSVRDALIGKEIKDIDFCTNAAPEQVKEVIDSSRWFKYFDSGLKHGTLTLVDNAGRSFEITTYRDDGHYSEDHRHPEEVKFITSLEEDLKRRDFTINALAFREDINLDYDEDHVSFSNQELVTIDKSFLDDLKYGVIRCVGDPDKRFQEDALRMLRAIRFAAQLGFTIEINTYEAIKRNKDLIRYISQERIRDELSKILLSKNPHYIEYIYLTGLSDFIFPEFHYLVDCKQHNKYHYSDCLHHSLDVMRQVSPIFELRWAALLHDIGKLNKETKDPNNEYYHYYDHPEESCRIAAQIMERLKFTNEQTANILNLIKYHDAQFSDKTKLSNFKRLINNLVVPVEWYIELITADKISHKLYREKDFMVTDISAFKEAWIKIKETKDPMGLKDLDIDGNDLLAIGLKGKEIGDALQKALEHVIEKPEDNKKEVLLEIIKK